MCGRTCAAVGAWQVEATGVADAERVRAAGDAQAELISDEGSKKAAELLAESDTAVRCLQSDLMLSAPLVAVVRTPYSEYQYRAAEVLVGTDTAVRAAPRAHAVPELCCLAQCVEPLRMPRSRPLSPSRRRSAGACVTGTCVLVSVDRAGFPLLVGRVHGHWPGAALGTAGWHSRSALR